MDVLYMYICHRRDDDSIVSFIRDTHGMSRCMRIVRCTQVADGYRDDGSKVRDGRLMFPPLAAGGLGSPAALAEWLRQLAVAYKRPQGCGPIAHSTALAMLTPGPDLGRYVSSKL